MRYNNKNLIEEKLENIKVYHDKDFKKIKFELLLTNIVSAVKEAIEYLKSINFEGDAILIFNDVELKIRQYSYYKDKVDEYLTAHRLIVEKNLVANFNLVSSLDI